MKLTKYLILVLLKNNANYSSMYYLHVIILSERRTEIVGVHFLSWTVATASGCILLKLVENLKLIVQICLQIFIVITRNNNTILIS